MARTADGRPALYAEVGDLLVVPRAHLGGPARKGEVLAVRRADGGPPYLVRWYDDGYQGLVSPGPEAFVEHVHRRRAP
jgi:hypothetical protein